MGACLVGDAKCITFDCHNVGGRGRFRLLMPEDFPEPSAAQRDNLALRMPPFNVTPTEFALNTGDSVEITVRVCARVFGLRMVPFRERSHRRPSALRMTPPVQPHPLG